MLNAGAYSDLETALLPIPGVVAANEEKLLKLTPSFIDTIVRRILAMPTDGDGHGLRVASKLCAAYGLSPKEVAVRIRLLSYVTAGKWQLARMQSKSSALMLMTYEALINAKKYHAAERVHKYFGKKLLDREGKPVPPVTKAMVSATGC